MRNVIFALIGFAFLVVIILSLAGGMNQITDPLVTRIADAIVYAEGGDRAGTRPFKNNNPGDLTEDLNGWGIGFDGPFVIYSKWSDGYDALLKQVRLFFAGSKFYRPTMTISDVAMEYTDVGGAPEWARNVASRLGVSPNTRLMDLQSV